MITKADLDIDATRAWREGSSENSRYRLTEVLYVNRQLDALYARVSAGDDTVRTRQRIARLESLQAALQGYPAALSK